MAVGAYHVSDPPLVWNSKFLSLRLKRLATIELSPCLGVHGLKYMDINTVYSAPSSTLLTKSSILQSGFHYVCVL